VVCFFSSDKSNMRVTGSTGLVSGLVSAIEASADSVKVKLQAIAKGQSQLLLRVTVGCCDNQPRCDKHVMMNDRVTAAVPSIPTGHAMQRSSIHLVSHDYSAWAGQGDGMKRPPVAMFRLLTSGSALLSASESQKQPERLRVIDVSSFAWHTVALVQTTNE